MPPVISVESLSKKFQIGLREKKHQTFREAVMDTFAAPLRRFRELSGNGHADSEFWALKDVSFEVQEGEVLGIIGRNGAGKSTLLKILSRITEPTSGRAVIRGRVASLLEVGTGFHNELTGHENVYLNGAILGMSKTEIDRKFGEIVDFSGVEKFLDTAIKHYSSGMKVRLAFAVAAHLDPEILIIDEVLAVGDQEFQNKCMGKMQDVATGGRTVLFVSHNMAAVEALCGECILLVNGQVSIDDETSRVLEMYCSGGSFTEEPFVELANHGGRPPHYSAIMRSAWIGDVSDRPTTTFDMSASVRIHVNFDLKSLVVHPVLGVVIKTQSGATVFGNDNRTVAGFQLPIVRGTGGIMCEIQSLPLMPGRYHIDLWFGDSKGSLDCVHDALTFHVIASNVSGTGKLPTSQCGPIYWPASWKLEPPTVRTLVSTGVLRN